MLSNELPLAKKGWDTAQVSLLELAIEGEMNISDSQEGQAAGEANDWNQPIPYFFQSPWGETIYLFSGFLNKNRSTLIFDTSLHL